MQIRKVNLSDLDKIVNVHKQCFKNSFSTQLGNKLLKKFYETYLNQNPDLFFAAEEETIVGFCMGYLCTDANLTKRLIKNNLVLFTLRCLLLTVIFNKQMWGKLFSIFKKKNNDFEIINKEFSAVKQHQVADLLSICVVDTFRGKGASSALVDVFFEKLKEKGFSYCILSVDPENSRAISFYKKKGFTIYKKSKECLVLKNDLINKEVLM